MLVYVSEERALLGEGGVATVALHGRLALDAVAEEFGRRAVVLGLVLHQQLVVLASMETPRADESHPDLESDCGWRAMDGMNVQGGLMMMMS